VQELFACHVLFVTFDISILEIGGHNHMHGIYCFIAIYMMIS